MMSRIDIFKSSLLAVFSVPYLVAAYFMGHGALDLNRFGESLSAGLIGALAVLLGLIGVVGLVASRWSKNAPDYLVALHSVVALLFVIISMQA